MKQVIAAGLLATCLLCVPALTPGPLAPPATAQEQRIPIAVLNLSPKGGVSEGEASIITDRIRTLVVQSGRFQVMERESMDKILREQGFQTTQDCDSNACSLEIGRLLSVRAMVIGSVSKLGSLYSLNLRVIDVERGTILKEEFVDCNCSLESLLVDKTGPLLKRLLGLNSEAALAPSPEPSPTPDAGPLPIRRRRPWLFNLEVGFRTLTSLTLQYNYNEYGAFRMSGTYGLNYSAFTVPFTLFFPSFSVGARIYFSDQDLAAFGEANYGVSNVLSPRLGLEYRGDSGWTWQAAAGWGFGAGGSGPDTMLSVGYAF